MKRVKWELVGIQVTRSKAFRRYKIDNVYAEREGIKHIGYVLIPGYDMTLTEPFDDIVHHLLDVYASQVKHVWTFDGEVTERFYIQFDIRSRPSKVGLLGHWEHWAEW